MDDYREDLAYDHTKRLTKWYRFVGSDGENKAKRYIFGQFTGLGAECYREPFKCSNFLTKYLLRIGLLLMATLLILAGYFYWVNDFLLALLVGIGLLVVLIGANSLWTGSDLGSGLGTVYETENLIGCIKAQNPRPKRTVYIIGHYDTKSQSFPVLLRIILFVISALGSLILGAIIVIGCLIWFINASNIFMGFAIFVSAIAISISDILLLFNRTGNKSVGATDNAAAIGVMIAIIRNLLDFPPQNTNLYFLATSAEEIGLMGATAFIKRHEKELDKEYTYFLNYDIIGGKGKIILHTRYGIPPKKTSDEINNILLEIAKEKNLDVGTQYLPVGAAADHLPILKRGFKTTWIQTGDRKVTTKIHTTKDNMDLITKESLRTAIILGFEFIQKIDKKP
ncbi:MAG: M28 family metallopeptidase [Candidatus Helarchaeota archaeon]